MSVTGCNILILFQLNGNLVESDFHRLFCKWGITLKGIKVEGNTIYLMPANKDYQPIKVRELFSLIFFGLGFN
jgi:hypothetical protein